LKTTIALLLRNMEFRTLLILGLCACVAIAAPTDEDNENQGSGDSTEGSNENDVSAQEESDRRKLVAITRALDKIKDQLTEEEEDYLDDLLDDEDCEAAEELDEDGRQKRGCRSCSISNCPHKDKKHCGVTCCNGRPKCKCSWWNGKAKCKCT
jgi:hypothetical protein